MGVCRCFILVVRGSEEVVFGGKLGRGGGGLGCIYCIVVGR